MARYLIVTNKTALTTELHAKVGELAAADPEAEFAILVPEAPSENYTWEGETMSEARQNAEALRATLEGTVGAKVSRCAVGADDPLLAITNELRTNDSYDTLVICTLPLGASRWLRLDLVHQAARKFGLPVIHVVGATASS